MKILKANWIHPPEIDEWLRKMCIGRTLNVCCGKSKIGDVRLDILPYPKSNATEVGDLFRVKDKQGAMAFDTVICDPPFEYYFHGRNWLLQLSDVARKRLLLSAPQVSLHMVNGGVNTGKWEQNLYAFQMPTHRYLRLYYCFDRYDEGLRESYLPEKQTVEKGS